MAPQPRPVAPEKPRRSASDPVIELAGVRKYFKVGKNTVNVLRKIDLKIMPQEFLVILGPSGSGKSTLLNTLLGLEPPSEGQVVIMGHDITKQNANRIAKIRHEYFGIVFQRADWIGSINVLQNVTLPLAIHNVRTKERMARAVEKLTQVEMIDHAGFRPSELSGGQQQKVSLARALINDPPIVIADEPTGNLDSVSADKVMELFKQLNEQHHKTIIMVTHNLDYVRYGSRTIYIRDGAIVEGSEQLAKMT